jgi:pre-mRNA-splicing factor ATP-dependent RNA helicase DHX15/PRP43
MANRRPNPTDEGRSKRIKLESNEGGASLKAAANPYLAHYDNEDEEYNGNGYGNSYGPKARIGTGGKGSTDAFSKFTRHETTAKMAEEVEMGPANPFTGQNLSQKYFGILKKRRDLPVRAQR